MTKPRAQPLLISAPSRRMGLSAILATAAHAHPQRVAFVDPTDKPLWSGRAAMVWSYGAAAEIVARLANGIKEWRLPPASRVGVLMADGAEGFLAHLAVEAAGHLPCLLPLQWNEDHLVAAAQSASLSAVLTQSRAGASAPAERLCRAAARYFGLRYLAAFGPDIPDGVINLDAMALDGRGGPFSPDASGLVTFAADDPTQPIHRPADAMLAAIAAHLAASRVAPGDRILSLLRSSHLRGHVAGLGAAIVAGATLETLPNFDAIGFASVLAASSTRHLVAPRWPRAQSRREPASRHALVHHFGASRAGAIWRAPASPHHRQRTIPRHHRSRRLRRNGASVGLAAGRGRRTDPGGAGSRRSALDPHGIAPGPRRATRLPRPRLQGESAATRYLGPSRPPNMGAVAVPRECVGWAGHRRDPRLNAATTIFPPMNPTSRQSPREPDPYDAPALALV